ncbi:MAG: ABC transporter permease [Thermoleophilaceae bacterium]
MHVAAVDREVRVIEPRQPGVLERFVEAWRYRSLVRFFGRRFIEKLYLRTWLGWLWIPLRPIADLGSRVFVFGGLLGVGVAGVPYLLYVLVGMSAWELFDRTAYWATRSLELNRRFLRRIYIPRLTLLAGAIFPSLLNYGIYFLLTLIAVGCYAIADGELYLEFGVDSLLVPAGLTLLVLLALSIGLWLSVYGAQARDVRFGLSYALTFWFFVTPIVIPLSQIPDGYRPIVEINPVTGPMQMVKRGLFGGEPVPTLALVSTVVAIALIGGLGTWFFSRSESAALDSL